MDRVIYVHGKGGSAREADLYAPLFPGWRTEGIGRESDLPWEAASEIRRYFDKLSSRRLILIANSVGAFFSMLSGVDRFVERAYFISPVVDMARLIYALMEREGVTEKELLEKGTVRTGSGDLLDIRYLNYVKEHPVQWTSPLEILCGSKDALIPLDDVKAFAKRCGAGLCVMEGGEHWFHTDEQMRFLFQWISDRERSAEKNSISDERDAETNVKLFREEV